MGWVGFTGLWLLALSVLVPVFWLILRPNAILVVGSIVGGALWLFSFTLAAALARPFESENQHRAVLIVSCVLLSEASRLLVHRLHRCALLAL